MGYTIKKERNRRKITLNFLQYGFLPELLPADANGIPARITAVHRDRFALVSENGEGFGRLKTKEYYVQSQDFPTVGDFVLIRPVPGGDSQILRTLPRKSFFSRHDPDPNAGEQAVAANFDVVLLLQSLNRDFNLRRLERYLTLAWQSGASPAVVLTKADLAPDAANAVRLVQDTAIGIPVFVVSAKTGEGIAALSSLLHPGITAVFLGSSGVGKSSLVNALAGENIMETSAIREDDDRGRHTTTHRQLLLLPNGAMVIDTPGMRALGMWDVSTGLGETFTDVEALLGQCRFRDCRHESEPGCAIQAAIENGTLSRERWENYQSLKREAKYSEDQSAYLREKQKRYKNIAKWSRQRKFEDGKR